VVPREQDAVAPGQALDGLVELRIPFRLLVEVADLDPLVLGLRIAILARLFVLQVLLDLEDGELPGAAAVLGAAANGPKLSGKEWCINE